MRRIETATKLFLLLAFSASVSAQTPDKTDHPLWHLLDGISENRQGNSSGLAPWALVPT